MNTKVCNRCGREFPATTEYFNRKGIFDASLRPTCKECYRAYREANKEQERARYYKWQDENREHLDAYRKEYWSSHKEHKRQYDKAHSKIYRAAHAEEKKANTRNRRAKIKQAPGSHSADDVARLYKAQRGKCYWCGASVGNKYHVDHVIPITRGGSNDPSNLVISCPTCNLRKQAKLPHEWEDGGRLL